MDTILAGKSRKKNSKMGRDHKPSCVLEREQGTWKRI